MKFCLDDGTALLQTTVVTDPNATLVLPTARGEVGRTVAIPQASTLRDQPMRTQVDEVFASPGFPTAERSRKSPLPWILGIVVVLGASGIVIALILARALLPERQRADQAGMATSSPTPAAFTTRESPSSTPANSSDLPRQGVASKSPDRTQSNRADARTTPTSPPTPRSTPTPKPPSAVETGAETKPRPTIQGGVMNGKAVRLVQPPYPALARQAHASGTVVVRVLIDEAGNVISAQPLSGHPLLQSAAVAAARSSKFSPTKLAGEPVKVTGVIQYNFIAQ